MFFGSYLGRKLQTERVAALSAQSSANARERATRNS